MSSFLLPFLCVWWGASHVIAVAEPTMKAAEVLPSVGKIIKHLPNSHKGPAIIFFIYLSVK